MIKKYAWIAVLVAVVAGLAYPKVKPLLLSGASGGESVAAGPSASKTASAKNNASAGKGGEGGRAPLKVTTFLVQPAPFAETISSTGTVRADEGVELQAETNGKVVSINFVEGSAVKKGELLIKLNDADLRANLNRYNYGKQLAELRHRRYEQLFAQQVVTQDEYDEALNEVNVQQSFIDLYKAQIQKTEIRAPFDGIVGLRYVSVGAYVNANTRIATLQRLDELKIDFSVPEKYSGRIKSGSEITFTVAGGLQNYRGKIYAIDPRIDSGTRTLLVRAVCPNYERSLLPGAFTNVSIQLEQLPDALLIPAEAVIPGLNEKNVFVVTNGVAERRAVETGSRTATEVHIVSGLHAGDRVITSGLQQMRAGLAVDVAPEKNNATKGGDQQSRSAGSDTPATNKFGDAHQQPNVVRV